MVEHKDKKLLNWQPINFRLTSSLRMVGTKKENAEQMCAPSSIEAVRQAKIRQIESQSITLQAFGNKTNSEPPKKESQLRSDTKMFVEKSRPSSVNLWLE